MKNNPLMNVQVRGDIVIPYNLIKVEHFEPAIKHWLKVTKERIRQIKKVKYPTFDNIVLALENSSPEFDLVMSAYTVLNSFEKTPEIEKLGKKLNKYSVAATEWTYDSKLFQLTKELYLRKDPLSPEQELLLKEVYEGFIQSGANCTPEEKKRIKQISKELGRLELTYGDKVLKDMQYEIRASEDEVEGIPQQTLDVAKARADKKKVSGYIFDDFDVDAVISYGKNRELRKKMYVRASQTGLVKYNTEAEIKKIVALRNEEARIVGFKNHAELVLKGRMVKNLSNLNAFYKRIYPFVKKQALKDLATLKKMAAKDGIKDFQRYDEFYYRNELVKSKYQVDMNKVQEYFPLAKVWEGTQKVISKSFKISFHATKYPAYHKDVEAYEVRDSKGKKIGTLLMDWFNRKTKVSGAWMNDMVDGGFDRKTTAIIAMNLTKSKDNLMPLEEVKTLFHEMGHALHVLLSKSYYPSQSGVSVKWDFVELPSQFMENLVDEEVVLKQITSHYKTGKKLPKEIVDKIKKINTNMASLDILNQIFQGQLDLAVHNEKFTSVIDLDKRIYKKFHIHPYIKGTTRLAWFDHIMSSGYDIGYYSYLWADVLNKDAYDICRKTGSLDSPYMIKFRELLEKGSSQDESETYREFRGRDPDVKAYLKDAGVSTR